MKKSIARLATALGANRIASTMLRGRIYAIGYHSVTDKARSKKGEEHYADLSTDSALFDRQIGLLKKRGHTFYRFADLSRVRPSDERPTVVYFDDGFKDNLEVALPILEKHGATATVFIPSKYPGKEQVPLTAYFRFVLSKAGRTDIEERVAEFKRLSYADRRKSVDEIDSSVFREEWHSFDIYLNWDDVRTLDRSGIEIGSHTANHVKLTECGDPELASELSESKATLERELGHEVPVFSYPHGRSDERVQRALQAAGYRFAVTTEEGLNTRESIARNPYAMRKIGPRVYENLAEFDTRLYLRQFFRQNFR